jgi:hypothetical protein
MQVLCGNCKLSFDAPDGATGLVCPICRGPLLPKSAEGTSPKAAQEWTAGDLDDLIAILSAPAVSARVEVLPATGDAPVGEVHLLAGGVSEALLGGKSSDDALDKMRAIKPARYRVEQRLPNPANGDLSTAGPESGTLEGRALAHLMRYCEDYVITCSIEVWRGSETARVEYKRGEISGVTVGGIDAPERLAEVMQWSSGNYRLIVPPLKLPATAPKRAPAAAATPAPVPAPAPSAQAARQASATKTIFGMPAAEVQKARAAAEAAQKAAQQPAKDEGAKERRSTQPMAVMAQPAPAAPPAAAAPPVAAAAPTPAAAPPPAAARVTPPGVAPGYVTPPVSSSRPSATKTIFGVPAPESPGGFVPVVQQAGATTAPTSAVTSSEAEAVPTADKKTGARKVAVPAPDVVAPAAADHAPAPAAARAPEPAPAPRAPAPAPEPKRKQAPAPAAAAPATKNVGQTEKVHAPRRGAPVWAYAGVGVGFGLALLAIYHLVGFLGH